MVGQESLLEPKSKENELKRKEVEKKKKQLGEQNPTKNCSLIGNSTDCIERNLSDTSKKLVFLFKYYCKYILEKAVLLKLQHFMHGIFLEIFMNCKIIFEQERKKMRSDGVGGGGYN